MSQGHETGDQLLASIVNSDDDGQFQLALLHNELTSSDP